MMSTVGMSKSCTDLPSVTSTDDRWDVEIENLSKTCHWNYLFQSWDFSNGKMNFDGWIYTHLGHYLGL